MKYDRSEKQIEIYWWNMGKRTKDFIGTIGEYLKKRNIKVRKAPHIKGLPTKWIFKISVSSATTRLEIYEHQFDRAAEMAIQIFLTMMGDKTLMRATRDYKINWR